MRTVVKVGGGVAADPGTLADTVQALLGLAGETVVVHGGGATISRWLERTGQSVAFDGGLRVTGPEAMEVTAMVLSGWVNKRLVSALVSAGEAAVGVSGEDGGLLTASYKDRERLGEVGTVASVDPTPVEALLAAGLLPVISPVSRGPGGRPLNVNADEAALALAPPLRAHTLLLVSDVEGVLVGGSRRALLAADEALALVDSGEIHGGMAVKVRESVKAATAGVEIRIGGPQILRDPTAGTRIEPVARAEALA